MPIWNPFNSSQPSPPPVPASEAKNSSNKSSTAVIILPDGKQFGLKNFGNTCYANSVLQALYFCAPFRDLIIQTEDLSQQPQLQPHSQSDWLVPPATAPVLPSSITTPPASPGGRRRPERRPSANIASVADPHLSTTTSSPPTGPPIPARASTLFSALRSLYIHIAQNSLEKGIVAPSAFIDILKELNEEFRSTNHQDAHEFLNFLLNSVVEDIQKAKSALAAQGGNHHHRAGEDMSDSIATLGGAKSTSINSVGVSRDPTLVHKLFEGVLTSETRCLTCESVSSRDEAFLDLSIDIEKNSSITACLRQFSQSEMLCQKNKFFCDSCCDLQEAEKRMKIKKLPNVLALHLKRFKYQEDEGRFIKLAYRVPFPKELRLFNTVDDVEDPDRLYSLWAIVVHIGTGPNHGHYIAIIKTIGGWLCFDDESIYPVKEEDIPKYYGDTTSGSAYVLYYQAVDMDLHALGLPSRTPESEPKPEPVLASIVTTSITPISVSAPAAPALPPGLETDHSEISDSPAPTTPSSSLRAPSTPLSSEKEKVPLRVVPPPAGAIAADDTRNSPSTPTLGRPVSESGSRTLAQSVKKLGSNLAHRRSRVSLTPSSSSRPSTAAGKSEGGSAAGEHEPVPPIPALDMTHDHRPPERQSSTWVFKRRSKAEKSNREDGTEAYRHLPPPLPITPGGDEPNSGKDLPVTPWDDPDYHSSNHTHQCSYEPPLSSSAAAFGSTSSPKTLPRDMSSSIIGTSSSSRPSSSSHRSVHSAVEHRSSIEFPKTTLQPIPATPPSANRRQPSPSAIADAQGQRHAILLGISENDVNRTEVDHSRRGDADDSLHMHAPANPHAFDALHSISRSPPMSASPKLYPIAMHRSGSQAASVRASSASGTMGSEFGANGGDAGGTPSSYHHYNGSGGVGSGSGNGAQNGSSSGGGAAMFKRASRKLSISASLGFGRKK